MEVRRIACFEAATIWFFNRAKKIITVLYQQPTIYYISKFVCLAQASSLQQTSVWSGAQTPSLGRTFNPFGPRPDQFGPRPICLDR